MKTLRRYHIENTLYFITAVTYKREPLLLIDPGLFLECWSDTKPSAWVLLPDHFHAIIEITDPNISMIMHQFKITYSRRFRDMYQPGRVWQNRFWDHVIRDQNDLNRHLDYIHYNPVRHGLVDDPFGYEYSSLNIYFSEGYYTCDWGVNQVVEFEGEFGE